jgi:acetamidase/formamidase
MVGAHINHSNIHLKWSKNIPPVLTVASGTELVFSLRDGLNNQITPATTTADLENVDFAQADPAFGPVAVEGAEPGDVLRVEVLSLKTAAYGWTAIFPTFGLLSDDFGDEVHLKIWDLAGIREKGYVEFKPGVRVPADPFLGVMGVAPALEGDFGMIPPYDWGGNIDCRHVTVGSTLFLPVQVPGALFSCGDGHASQGDGEVCGTAIETPMTARLRLTLDKGPKPWVRSPHYLTRPCQQPTSTSASRSSSSTDKEAAAEQVTPPPPRGQEYAVLGIDADLREAARKALRSAIEWLVGEKGLTKVEAYMLCSVVADLKIAEAVDMPHYAVACAVPLSIFVD